MPVLFKWVCPGYRLIRHSLVYQPTSCLSTVYNMPRRLNTDPAQAAASTLNFISLLVFWLRHLPNRLPAPSNTTDPVYNHFYRVMTQIYRFGESYPTSLPNSTGIVTIRITEDDPPPVAAPEAPAGRPPPPPPPPRHPRARAADQPGASPEAMARPAPQPPHTVNRRKSYTPVRRD